MYEKHSVFAAIDGQQIYLHSLNVRMLEKQYGSLEQSPPILVGNIVEIETGSMTEELRKRLRYLDHLPITCQFQVVEIDVEKPTISTATRVFFKGKFRFMLRCLRTNVSSFAVSCLRRSIGEKM